MADPVNCIPIDYGCGPGTQVGLTIAKIIQAQMRFKQTTSELAGRLLVIGPSQEVDLLKQARVVETDFGSRPLIEDGTVKSFLGFRVLISTHLKCMDGVRECIAFSGPMFSEGRLVYNKIAIECVEKVQDNG